MRKILYLLFFVVIIITSGCVRENISKEKSQDVQKISLIGQYYHGVVSMCSQNCEDIILGPYILSEVLEDLPNFNLQNDIVWAYGHLIKVNEPPRIAGSSLVGNYVENSNNKATNIKLKVEDYKLVNLFDFSVSAEELANYLNYKEAKFDIKFTNPLNEELRLKIKIDKNDFQYINLEPNEIKNIEYIYSGDIINTYYNSNKIIERQDYDDFSLVIINDFLDYDYFKDYYKEENFQIKSFEDYLELKYGNIDKTLVFIDLYHLNLNELIR